MRSGGFSITEENACLMLFIATGGKCLKIVDNFSITVDKICLKVVDNFLNVFININKICLQKFFLCPQQYHRVTVFLPSGTQYVKPDDAYQILYI